MPCLQFDISATATLHVICYDQVPRLLHPHWLKLCDNQNISSNLYHSITWLEIKLPVADSEQRQNISTSATFAEIYIPAKPA